jgi:hypothetical protein
MFKRSDSIISNKRLSGSHTCPHRRLDSFLFQIVKMYWEEGYCWHQEWDEREGCLECEGSTCEEDNHLWLKKCDGSGDEQWFVYETVMQLPKRSSSSHTQGKIFAGPERESMLISLSHVAKGDYLDDEGRDKQVLIGIQQSGSFEPHPNGRSNACMINHIIIQKWKKSSALMTVKQAAATTYDVHTPTGEGTPMPAEISDTLNCGIPDYVDDPG